ncbi:hypothetical protein D3C81_415460 [compost metagenome]
MWLVIAIAAFDADHRPAQMIFWCASEVLEPKLVLDCHDQLPAWLEQGAHARQHCEGGIIAAGEHIGVFQHADQRDDIKLVRTLELIKLLAQYGNIVEVARARTGDGSTPRATLECQYLCTAFAQKARDGAATGTYFQHIGTTQHRLKRSHQVGARAAQVINGWPVDAVLA